MPDKVLFASNSYEWVTPQDFFDKLDEEFHFDLDVAADDNNHKCEHYYTKETDGLAHQDEWFGNVWCNPPYGRDVINWVRACAEYRKGTCVLLIPARTDTRWFHEYIYKNDRVEIRFVRGRLHFNNCDRAPFPSMVAIFRNERGKGGQ